MMKIKKVLLLLNNVYTHCLVFFCVLTQTTNVFSQSKYILEQDSIYIYRFVVNEHSAYNSFYVEFLKIGDKLYSFHNEAEISNDVFTCLQTGIASEDKCLSLLDRIEWKNKSKYLDDIYDVFAMPFTTEDLDSTAKELLHCLSVSNDVSKITYAKIGLLCDYFLIDYKFSDNDNRRFKDCKYLLEENTHTIITKYVSMWQIFPIKNKKYRKNVREFKKNMKVIEVG